MDYRYLKAFLSVSEHQNFTQAAEDLGIAQSAVSRQIKLFEDSVGTQLFVRSPQAVLLTPKGKELFRQARGFTSWIDDTFLETVDTVRMGTLPGLLDNWLTRRISALPSADIPNLEIHTGTSDELKGMLIDGKLDIALHHGKIDNKLVSSRLLMVEEYILISRRKLLSPNLSDYRWIYLKDDSLFRKVSAELSPYYIMAPSYQNIVEMVEAGVGIAIVPKHILNVRARIEKRPLEKLRKKLYVSLPKYQVLPPEMSRLMKRVFY